MMDSRQVYSTSLKRMLGLKLFPNINPEEVLIAEASQKNASNLADFVQAKKTDKQIERMKKEIQEARKKQHQFEKEIDTIVGHMVEGGFAQVVSKKVRKHGSTHKLRIVTEAPEPKDKSNSKAHKAKGQGHK